MSTFASESSMTELSCLPLPLITVSLSVAFDPDSSPLSRVHSLRSVLGHLSYQTDAHDYPRGATPWSPTWAPTFVVPNGHQTCSRTEALVCVTEVPVSSWRSIFWMSVLPLELFPRPSHAGSAWKHTGRGTVCPPSSPPPANALCSRLQTLLASDLYLNLPRKLSEMQVLPSARGFWSRHCTVSMGQT